MDSRYRTKALKAGALCFGGPARLMPFIAVPEEVPPV